LDLLAIYNLNYYDAFVINIDYHNLEFYKLQVIK